MGGGGAEGQRNQRKGQWSGVALPASVEISFGVVRHKTGSLLHVVNQKSLFHHIPLPVGNDFLEVVGQDFATYLDPATTERDNSKREDGKWGWWWLRGYLLMA